MTTFHRGRRLRATPELRTLVREPAPLLVEDLVTRCGFFGLYFCDLNLTERYGTIF